MDKKLFCYSANSGSLATGNNIQKTITFDADTTFLLREFRTLNTAMTIQIQTSSGYLFQNTAFTSSGVGSGNNSVKTIPDEIKIPANSSWIVTFTNNSGGTLTDEVQFWGFKQ